MLTGAFLSPAGLPQRSLRQPRELSVGSRVLPRRRLAINLCAAAIALAACAATAAETAYPLEVLPPEHQRMTDPRTGAELLFLTTGSTTNLNLYFHEHSWLADESVILFTSTRAKGGLMV